MAASWGIMMGEDGVPGAVGLKLVGDDGKVIEVVLPLDLADGINREYVNHLRSEWRRLAALARKRPT